jgi:hypothetical protein
MVTRVILTAALVCGPLIASAGTVTFDFGTPLTLSTTPKQDLLLERARSDANLQAESRLTMEEFLREALIREIQAAVQSARKANQTTACEKFQTATPEIQAQIMGALDDKNPCP